jgi:hypothetical protein
LLVTLILLCVSFEALLHGFVIEQSIPCHHVQPRRVGCAVPVKHGANGPTLPHGVDDERVAFVVAYGISILGRVACARCCAFMRMRRT